MLLFLFLSVHSWYCLLMIFVSPLLSNSSCIYTFSFLHHSIMLKTPSFLKIKCLAWTWQSRGWREGFDLGFQQGMGRRERNLGHCFGAWRALSQVFNLLPWEIQQEKVIFWYSLLSKSYARTSVFLLLLMETMVNILYFLSGAPIDCAGRLLLQWCRTVLVFLHLKLVF